MKKITPWAKVHMKRGTPAPDYMCCYLRTRTFSGNETSNEFMCILYRAWAESWILSRRLATLKGRGLGDVHFVDGRRAGDVGRRCMAHAYYSTLSKRIQDQYLHSSSECTVHRWRVDPRKECESCGNARFCERKHFVLLSNVKTFVPQRKKWSGLLQCL
jgi:hypothetical protein